MNPAAPHPPLCHLSTNTACAVLLLIASIATPGAAIAFDLNGAWATDGNNCAKVFVRNGSQVTFTDMSDVYGSGFIVEGDQLTGKFARCRVTARKVDGKSVNLVASCATDIMLQSVQFSLREADANSVIRMFPGMEGMEIKYTRCPVP